MAGILMQERVLGLGLGLAGGLAAFIYEQKHLWRSTGALADVYSGGKLPPAEIYVPEPIFGRKAQEQLIHAWNAGVDNTLAVKHDLQRSQWELKRHLLWNVEGCGATAAEQEKIELEQWLPELKVSVQEAQKCLEYSKHVRELVDEWWDQPASTAVDWITVDGQNVAAGLARVKQVQATFYEKQLL